MARGFSEIYNWKRRCQDKDRSQAILDWTGTVQGGTPGHPVPHLIL